MVFALPQSGRKGNQRASTGSLSKLRGINEAFFQHSFELNV